MRFIQIGIGGFGRAWVDVLKNDRRAKVVGLVDLDKTVLGKVCDDEGYDKRICFTSLNKALKKVDADALVCVTPPVMHRKHVTAGLRAGLHVISEKPMAASITDCKAMLREARKCDKTYVVSQNYRHRPPVYTMAEMIRKGVIGEVGQVKVDFYKGMPFKGFRAEMDFPLLVDMSIHHFDLIRYVTGLDPVSVRGEAWNPPWSHYQGKCSSSVAFEMNNQAKVLYNGSWCAQGDYCDWNGNWQIEGSKGTILYSKGSVVLNKAPKDYAVRESKEIPHRKMKKMNQACVLDTFIKSVKAGTRADTDVYDNIKSIAMVFRAVEAVETGTRVKVVDSSLNKLIGGK